MGGGAGEQLPLFTSGTKGKEKDLQRTTAHLAPASTTFLPTMHTRKTEKRRMKKGKRRTLHIHMFKDGIKILGYGQFI